LLRIIPYKKRIRLAKNINFSVYNDRFFIDSENYCQEIYFKDISAVSVLGRNKLNIYVGSNIVQVKSKNKRFNAVKYMNIYYHASNMAKGVSENDKLLGI
jgi:hypothetical protein